MPGIYRVPGSNVIGSLRRISAIISLIFLVFAVGACAARLAPPYDPSILQGLTQANKEALQLFAAVSNGTSPSSFAQRKNMYAQVIGAFEALRIEAAARPAPRSRIATGLASRADFDPDSIERLPNPTPRILENLGNGLVEMRESDRRRGLSPNLVTGYKNIYTIRIEQVLVFEKALRR